MNQPAQQNWNPDIEFPIQNKPCLACGGHLNKRMNIKYDATTLGYCDKLCLKDMDKKLITEEKLTSEEASHMLEELTKDYTFLNERGEPFRKEGKNVTEQEE